jgi:DinB superfamily
LRNVLPKRVLLTVLLAAPAVFGAEGIGKVFDDQVSTVEREVLGLAQKMPADKYDFAPTNGTFTGVRTYALQVRHIATYIYRIAASVSGEKAPVEIGPTDNGPDSLKTKDQIIDYFKGALAFAHKAMGTLTEKNMYDQVPSPFGRGTMTRVAAAAFLGQHSYDHYGQMVVYGRMNGVIPGGGPPPAGKGKSN